MTRLPTGDTDLVLRLCILIELPQQSYHLENSEWHQTRAPREGFCELTIPAFRCMFLWTVGSLWPGPGPPRWTLFQFLRYRACPEPTDGPTSTTSG